MRRLRNHVDEDIPAHSGHHMSAHSRHRVQAHSGQRGLTRSTQSVPTKSGQRFPATPAQHVPVPSAHPVHNPSAQLVSNPSTQHAPNPSAQRVNVHADSEQGTQICGPSQSRIPSPAQSGQHTSHSRQSTPRQLTAQSRQRTPEAQSQRENATQSEPVENTPVPSHSMCWNIGSTHSDGRIRVEVINKM